MTDEADQNPNPVASLDSGALLLEAERLSLLLDSKADLSVLRSGWSTSSALPEDNADRQLEIIRLLRIRVSNLALEGHLAPGNLSETELFKRQFAADEDQAPSDKGDSDTDSPPTVDQRKGFRCGRVLRVLGVVRWLRMTRRRLCRSTAALPETPILNRLLDLKIAYQKRDCRAPALERLAYGIGLLKPERLQAEDNAENEARIQVVLREFQQGNRSKRQRRPRMFPEASIERELLDEADAMPRPIVGLAHKAKILPGYDPLDPRAWERATRQEARRILKWIKTGTGPVPRWFQVHTPHGHVENWFLPEDRGQIAQVLADRVAVERDLVKNATQRLKAFFFPDSENESWPELLRSAGATGPEILALAEWCLTWIKDELIYERDARRARRALELLIRKKLSTGWNGYMRPGASERRQREAARLDDLADVGQPTLQEAGGMPPLTRLILASRILAWWLECVGLPREVGLDVWLMLGTLPNYLPRQIGAGLSWKRPELQMQDPVFADLTCSVNTLLSEPRTRGSLKRTASALSSLLAAMLTAELGRLARTAGRGRSPNGTPLTIARLCFLVFPEAGSISPAEVVERTKRVRRAMAVPVAVRKADLDEKNQKDLFPTIAWAVAVLPPLDPTVLR